MSRRRELTEVNFGGDLTNQKSRVVPKDIIKQEQKSSSPQQTSSAPQPSYPQQTQSPRQTTGQSSQDYSAGQSGYMGYSSIAPESFRKSEALAAAEKYLDDIISAGYKSSYSDRISQLIDEYSSRSPFVYDPDSDPLYAAAKDNTVRQGRLAMQDTVGKVNAASGGYGNSYAATAGQQAYAAHLDTLNDILPEYYSLARSAYDAEGQDMLNRIGLMSEQDLRDYERWSDDVTRRMAMADTAYNREYGEFADDYARRLNQAEMDNSNYWNRMQMEQSAKQWDDQMQFNRENSARSDRQWQDQLNLTARQYETEKEQWDKEWQMQNEAWQRQKQQQDAAAAAGGMLTDEQRDKLEYMYNNYGSAIGDIYSNILTEQTGMNAESMDIIGGGLKAAGNASGNFVSKYTNGKFEIVKDGGLFAGELNDDAVIRDTETGQTWRLDELYSMLTDPGGEYNMSRGEALSYLRSFNTKEDFEEYKKKCEEVNKAGNSAAGNTSGSTAESATEKEEEEKKKNEKNSRIR